MKKLSFLLLLTLILGTTSAQKYKRITPVYNFSFTKDGKMKVVMGDNELMAFNAPKELVGQNEIILWWNIWESNWTAYIDRKVGDSTVKDSEIATSYISSICFIRKGDKLIVSERFNETIEPLMTPDPETGEMIDAYDEYGNLISNTIFSGGYFEINDLKTGKSLVKKDGHCLRQVYGEKYLTIRHEPAEDTYYDTYSMYDSKGATLIDTKTLEELYGDDNLLSQLVNSGKADKILFRCGDAVGESFCFQQNGKMGVSCLWAGVKMEPKYELAVSDYDSDFYLDAGKLNLKFEDKSYSASQSMMLYVSQMDYMVNLFVDGKNAYLNSDYGDYEPSEPSISYSETFLKKGNLVIFSKPYYESENMMYEGVYVPSRSELGTLVIYDAVKKQILFGDFGHSIINMTDAGILIQQIDTDEYGNYTYTYHIMDYNGNYIQKDISASDFNTDPQYMLKLMPPGTIPVSFDYAMGGQTLIYLLNGKVGAMPRHQSIEYTIAPTLKWFLAGYHDGVRITEKEVMDNTDTVSYSGNLPYILKEKAFPPVTFIARGASKITYSGYDASKPHVGKIDYTLVDTSYYLNSVEFYGDYVIQNLCSRISAYSYEEYDEMTGEPFQRLDESGNLIYTVDYSAKSGVMNLKTGKWIIPQNEYRIIHKGKYFFSSNFGFESTEMGLDQFKSICANPKFKVWDETGNFVMEGTAAEVKKKTGIDPKTLKMEF